MGALGRYYAVNDTIACNKFRVEDISAPPIG